jgi:hypothetical protein
VTSSWKDYADGCQKKLMTLDAVELLRRFLLHVLPHGLVRIRHCGLCASSNVNTRLVTARRLLEPDTAPPASEASVTEPKPWWERFHEQTGVDGMACPCCKTGRMHRLRPLSALDIPMLADCVVAGLDTS